MKSRKNSADRGASGDCHARLVRFFFIPVWTLIVLLLAAASVANSVAVMKVKDAMKKITSEVQAMKESLPQTPMQPQEASARNSEAPSNEASSNP